jgi:hypothetical protein
VSCCSPWFPFTPADQACLVSVGHESLLYLVPLLTKPCRAEAGRESLPGTH